MNTEPLGAGIGAVVVPIARGAIASELGVPFATDESAAWLDEPAATFVTLRQDGDLRGCMGTLEAHRSLRLDLKHNAVAAAFRDPRFRPLTRRELPATEVEVSILSATEPLAFVSEDDARAALRPFVDGVVFEYGVYRSTFLPQVWEQLPDPGEFLGQLKRKAGLPADFWAPGVRLARYTVAKYLEARELVR
jgi:AmmeMemoRadiSam system protein A